MPSGSWIIMRASRAIPRMGEAVPNTGGLADWSCGGSTQSHESRHRAWSGGDDGGKGKQAKRGDHRSTRLCRGESFELVDRFSVAQGGGLAVPGDRSGLIGDDALVWIDARKAASYVFPSLVAAPALPRAVARS